jgi:hypothetical protein
MYYDIQKKYSPKQFFLFVELVEHINGGLCLIWWKEPSIKIDYVAFYVRGRLYMFNITNHTTRMINLVDRETWSNIVDSMKK